MVAQVLHQIVLNLANATTLRYNLMLLSLIRTAMVLYGHPTRVFSFFDCSLDVWNNLTKTRAYIQLRWPQSSWTWSFVFCFCYVAYPRKLIVCINTHFVPMSVSSNYLAGSLLELSFPIPFFDWRLRTCTGLAASLWIRLTLLHSWSSSRAILVLGKTRIWLWGLYVDWRIRRGPLQLCLRHVFFWTTHPHDHQRRHQYASRQQKCLRSRKSRAFTFSNSGIDHFHEFGWMAAALEWLTTYLVLWPEDGKMKKEDVRSIYDVSDLTAIRWNWLIVLV